MKLHVGKQVVEDVHNPLNISQEFNGKTDEMWIEL